YTPIAGSLESALKQPPRIGLIRDLFWERAEPAAREMIEAAANTLRAQGAAVRDVSLPANFADVLLSHRIIMSVEAAAVHEERFKQHRDAYLPKIRGLVEEGLATPGPAYVRAKVHQRALTQTMAD